MKKVFTFVFIIALCILTYFYQDQVVNYLSKLIDRTPNVVMKKKNQYAKNESYEYISVTDDFRPYNYQELLNVIYTILDAGYKEFTFYCPVEYTDCVSDVTSISDENNANVLTSLGNYLSPFNNFSHIKILYDTAGEITIKVTYLYSEDEIDKINAKIDEIWKKIVKTDMNEYDIIYAFHDYIINNTKYDEKYEEELKKGITTTYQSAKAIGPLFEGYGICSGYTDTMAIVLDRLNIKNFKIASKSHVWNAVYYKDSWKHLDLTWDDPVSNDRNQNNLIHKFFLIDTNSLKKFDIKDHNFDKTIYLEFYEK